VENEHLRKRVISDDSATLLRQGLASRGHDESESSLNKGNFLELLNMLAKNFEEVANVVLKNAPKNC